MSFSDFYWINLFFRFNAGDPAPFSRDGIMKNRKLKIYKDLFRKMAKRFADEVSAIRARVLRDGARQKLSGMLNF